MTGTLMLSIFQTESGSGFKVYITGQASGHLMDWSGMNYRHVSVAGQPRLGFASFDAAEAFMQTLEQDKARLEREYARARPMTGSWLPEWRYASRCHCRGCRKVKLGEFVFCADCPPPYSAYSCAKHRQVDSGKA